MHPHFMAKSFRAAVLSDCFIKNSKPIWWRKDCSMKKSLRMVYACSLLEGWSGGAKMLAKLPVSGRPTNLD